MQTLNEFTLPNDGEISLCEIDGRILSQNCEYANVSTLTTALEKHPKIQITRDLLQPTTSGDEGRALFLPVHVSFLKQLAQIYYEQGFLEALHAASNHPQVLIANGALLLLKTVNYVKRIQVLLNPALKYNSKHLINDLSTTKNWSNNSIRCISWHPHLTRIAVATCDDSVKIFSNCQTNYVPLLRCKQQKNITCLAWRPSSTSELAVGHENGIIIWNVDPNSLVTRPSISNATILHRFDHKPVVSLSWGVRGEILISAAACDPKILIWDVELDRTSCSKSGTFGNTLLKLSPKGDKLFSATNGIVFKIWNCCTWESERWTVLDGRVQAACWVNKGTDLLFATDTDPILYSLTADVGIIFATQSNSSPNLAVPIYDMNKVELDGTMVGGVIQNMESDPDGKHLAVLFRDTNCVAVFNVVKFASLQLIASSLIMGLPAEVPVTIAFQQDFKNGACLTVAWSSGRIQYYPIIYTDIAGPQAKKNSVNDSLNAFVSGQSFFL